MESMTGFGICSKVIESHKITVLTKSVNNKGLSLVFRIPRETAHLEQALHRIAREIFSRGRIDVSISLERDSSAAPAEPDIDLAGAYMRGAGALAEKFSLSSSPDAFQLVTLPGVMREPEPSVGECFDSAVISACRGAFESLLSSRREEGKGLAGAFRVSLESISDLSGPVLRDHSERVQAIFQERKKRVADLLNDANVDENRLAQELALLSDRMDISEEHQRLSAHIRSALAILTENDSGRKLGFILQEMHRELNTMGSKADCSEAVHRVIEMKDLLGGLREQVANVQ